MSPRPTRGRKTDLCDVQSLATEGRMEAAMKRLDAILGPHPAESNRHAAVSLLRVLAREAQAAGDLAGSIVLLDTAVRLAPGFADLHFQHAMALDQRQQRHDARRALEQALKLNPNYLAARIELALLDAREGMLGDSITALRALADDPRLEEPAVFQQGLKRLQQADWNEAGSLLRRSLKLSDPVLDALFERYHAFMDGGEPERAAQAVRETLPRFEGYPDLHFLLASAELRSGHFDDAIASFARALELNPEFHAARLEMARALEAIGQVDQAREQVSLVLEARPDDPLALEMHARWANPRHHAKSPAESGQKEA
jgi:tetratricopeptide (TPR) repeat protein